jgi:hypothetical protein
LCFGYFVSVLFCFLCASNMLQQSNKNNKNSFVVEMKIKI